MKKSTATKKLKQYECGGLRFAVNGKHDEYEREDDLILDDWR